MQMDASFTVGDKVVYPTHGVADVVALEDKKIGNMAMAFYHLHVVESGLKIIVPVAKAQENGMRHVASQEAIDELFSLLRDHNVEHDRQTWNRRYRGFMEKIRTGSLFEVGQVFRDLSLLKNHKTLSHGERQMLNTARNLVIRELSTARKAPESEVAAELDSMFKN
ncbi:MAG: CarD family transcriptional regulator [Myxococcales bacterium]|nr:CarD family transcriptional regulator [Myxococcales bacterium]MCB9752536.1 CarD family transcriptional regulator [Myxococcales bacterium]